MPSPSQVPPGYRAFTIMVRDQDTLEVKRISEKLKGEGWTHASMSFVARTAFVMLMDMTRGKAGEELLDFFVSYRRKRAQQQVGTAGAVNEA